MQVKLKKDLFWMLGDSGPPRIHISVGNPVSEEFEFTDLSPAEQEALMKAVRSGYIESSVKMPELLDMYTQSQQDMEEVDAPTMQDQVVAKQMERIKEEKERLELEEKRNKDIDFVLSRSVKAVKSKVSSIDDIHLLNTYRAREVKEKNRKTVLRHINNRINSLTREMIERLDMQARKQDNQRPGFKVEETEEDYLDISVV